MAFYDMSLTSSSYASNAIDRPQIPFTGAIPGGMTASKQIFIRGNVPPNSNTIEVELLARNEPAFHVSIRFEEYCVVRNTCQNGEWGNEERSGVMPFFRGQPFEMTIVAQQDKYTVNVNGAHAFDYKKRVLLYDADKLRINGDVAIDKINFNSSGTQPSNIHEINYPQIPFTTPIVNGSFPGRIIQINGNVPSRAKRFSINLQRGTDSKADVQLHSSIRFDEPHSKQPVVVRNTRKNNKWETEERNLSLMPFSHGQPFEMLIKLESYEWQVTVNGQRLFSFAHRDAFQNATHLNIEGDVEVSSIKQF